MKPQSAFKQGLKSCLTAFLISLLLFFSACAKQPPSRFDTTQRESTQTGSGAVVKESQKGGNFNKFFPSAGSGYERVYTQEKKGFAEAKLKKEGKTVAMLAISDIRNNPQAATKFKNASTTIAGYPGIQQGKTATAILVADKFQVKVISRDSSFTESDRQEWLEKFNLNGLATLK